MTYTPTTEEVRAEYVSQGWAPDGSLYGENDPAEFDRWYAEEIRTAKAEAWALGYAQGKEDERLAESLQVDIGLGGHAAANRSNPYKGEA